MAISGSGETSCMISSIGKMGVRSGGPAGWPVCGFSGGSGSPGRSGRRLTQWVGMASSPRTYFVVALMAAILRAAAKSASEEAADAALMALLGAPRAAVLGERHLFGEIA